MKLLFILFAHFILLFICASCHPAQSQWADTTQALALFEKGKQYEQKQDVRNALISYWDALDLLDARQDTIQKAEVYIQLGDLLFRYGLYEKAAIHHREGYALVKNYSSTHVAPITHRLSIDYALLNQPDTASYFQKLTQQLAQQLPQQDIHQLTTLPIEQIKDQVLNDSIASVYEKEQLLNLETKYRNEKELLLQEKARTEQLLQLLVFSIIVCLFLVLLFIFYRKKKLAEQMRAAQSAWFDTLVAANKQQINEFQRELFGSRRQITELEHQLDAANISLEETVRLKEELHYYLQQQQEIQTKEKELRQRDAQLLSADSTQAVLLINRMKQKPVYNPIKTTDEWQILIDFTNVLYPCFSDAIRAIEGLTERDRQLCYLLKLGFTTAQLAIFYGISPGSVTKVKFRIRKKLEVSQCPPTTLLPEAV